MKKFETLKAQLGTGAKIRLSRIGKFDKVVDLDNCSLSKNGVTKEWYLTYSGYTYGIDQVVFDLFPLSHLNKPIRVEGYNDGKEFCPAVLLFDKFVKMGCVEHDEHNDQIESIIFMIQNHPEEIPYGWTVELDKMHVNWRNIQKSDYIDASKSKVYEPKQRTMNLQLSLKRQWFEMTKSGEKKEDYREITPYWIRRLMGGVYEPDFTIEQFAERLKTSPDANGMVRLYQKRFTTNTMTLGYPSKSDMRFKSACFKHAGIEIRTGRPEWGAEEGKVYFVIKHGERL